jgi:hypothetical protein
VSSGVRLYFGGHLMSGGMPEGHEWRQIDDNYVLANHDGTIVSVRPVPRNYERSHDKQPQ